MRHDRITSNRDVTATIPVFRIGLSPWKRTVSSEESMPRAWFTCLVARRILVRHFERIVARNKLIIIVIEIFLVQTSTPRGLLPACMNYGDADVLSCLLFINPFRPLDMRSVNKAGAQVYVVAAATLCDNRVVLFAVYHALSLLFRGSKGNEIGGLNGGMEEYVSPSFPK